MKQCFTHRLPSPVTLLNDPWPEDFSYARAKVEHLVKTGALPLALKSTRRKGASGPASS
jgi:hypothetical protein